MTNNKRPAEGSEHSSKSHKGDPKIASRCIDTVRVLSADMVEKANSGHPGAPMGCAPIAHVLFANVMKYNPKSPKWSDRDRFVLSNGHSCALLYSMLHLTGYELSLDDLKKFRQLGSKTPGHPENFLTAGVEVSTGPLGQGISNAVGLAIAESHLAATFNREGYPIVDHYTYVLCGDGCLQEGVSSEASSLAGHLGLGKLIVCYDDNHVTIDGDTALSFTEDVNMRYQSYGWHVQTVSDVNDIHALQLAIGEAKAVHDKPSLIKIRTIIGQGSLKEGTGHVHGAPLGAADLAQVKEKYGFSSSESFAVPAEVAGYYSHVGEAGVSEEQKWADLFANYSRAHPHLAAEYSRRMSGALPADWKSSLPSYSAGEAKAAATRNRSEEVLNALAKHLPELMGGSADLTPSNLTSLKGCEDFQKATPAGRYIRFGVREHGMAAICNGMFAHGGFRPYCATFMNFIGYALGSVRLSALSQFGVLYIMTHDSIGLGEDGPTHQPVEMLEYLRATPNLLTFRPCDGNETVGAYVLAMERAGTPAVISLSRQAAPTLERSSADKVALGAYTVHETAPGAQPVLVLAATGTEVGLAIQVARQLEKDNSHISVRVVSMPCFELFDKQTLEYQLEVFPDGVPVMSVEAAGVEGWRKYAHAPFGMTGYGCSAPGNDVYSHFGFTVANLSSKALEVVAFYAKYPHGAPSLLKYPRISHQATHH